MEAGISVLYVDDEPGLLEIARLFLEQSGEFRVTTLLSAREALASPAIDSCDAIVADYQMPVMDGISFLKEVRKQHGNVPFVLFTGRGREEVVIEAINNGADFYLQKGGDPLAQFAELAHKIRQAVRRKSAEENLLRSEERYRTIVDDQTELIVRFDQDGTITFANRAFREFLSRWLGQDGIVGRNYRNLLGPEKYESELGNFILELTPDQPIRDKETVETWPDGTSHWHQWSVRAFFAANGTATGYQGVGRDITGRKKAEDELRAAYEQITASEEELRANIDEIVKAQADREKTEQNFRNLVDSAPDAIYTHCNDRILYINNAAVRLFGGSAASQFVGTSIWDRIHPDYHDIVRERVKRLTVGKEPVGQLDEVYVRIDGTPVDVEVTAVPYEHEGQQGTLVMLRDITERKKQEQELRAAYEQITAADEELRDQYEELARGEHLVRESQERLRSFMDSATNAFTIWDKDLNLVDMNLAALAYLPAETKKEDIIGKNIAALITGYDEWGRLDRYREVIRTGIPFTGTEKLAGPQIGEHWLDVRCFRVGDGLGIVTSDVTRQKEAEEGLRMAKLVLENSPAVLFRWKAAEGWPVEYVSDNVIRFGYPPADLLSGKISFAAIVHPDDLERIAGEVATYSREGTDQYRQEYRIIAPDRRIFWVDDRTIIGRDRTGAITHYEGVLIDITEQKASQDLVRQSEERLRKVLAEAPLPLALVRQDGIVTFTNDRFVRVFGYTLAEAPTMESWWQLAYPDPAYRQLVRQQWDDAVRRSAEEHSDIRPDEYRVTCRNGDVRIVEISGVVLPDGFLATFIDHTERKRAEEALRESEEKYRNLVEKASEAITIIQDGRHVYGNPCMAGLVGIPVEDLPGTDFLETVWPDDRELLRSRYRQRMAGEDVPDSYEFRILGGDGKPRWIHLSVAKIQWKGRPATLNLMTDITELKTAEDALRASEKNYRDLIENSQSIIYTLLPDGTFSFVSPSWKTNLGHEPAEVVGHNFREFICPDDLPICEAFLKMTAETGTVRTSAGDYRIRHKDGSVHWHRSSVMPVFDDGNRIRSFVGNAVDVTSRKLAEDALNQSQAELTSILHCSPVLQFVIDCNHRVLSWNRALEEYSRVPAEEVLGTDRQWRAFYNKPRPVLADLLLDHDTESLARLYGGKLEPSRYVEGAFGATDFFPAMGASGTWLSFTAAPIRNAGGEVIGAVETLEDITERVAAEKALRASEERFRNIYHSTPTAIEVFDSNGVLADVNPACCTLFGLPSPDVIRGYCLFDDPNFPAPKRDQLKSGTAVRLQTEFDLDHARQAGFYPTTRSGRITVDIQFIPVRDGSGTISQYMAHMIDLTDRVAAEEAVREASRKLGLLNSITRHDIMNQLSLLQGYTTMAAKKETDPVIDGYLGRIDAASATIRRQIEFTKTYQELGVHSPGWFRIDQTAQKAGGALVSCSGSCRDIEVFSDPMLEKVFFNLVDNARRHGEHVTEIAVRCDPSPEGLVITVEDNGIGVPGEKKEKIFEKGFGKNSGYGLFLAREILSITGLTIRECGVEGKGARFEITVPPGKFRPVK